MKNIISLFIISIFFFSESSFSQSTGNTGVYYGGGNEQQPTSKSRFVYVSVVRGSPLGEYGQTPLNTSSGTIFDTYEGKNGGVGARIAYEYNVSWMSFKSFEKFNSQFSGNFSLGIYNSILVRYNRSLDWTNLNWELSDLNPYVTLAYEIGPSLSFANNHLFVNPFLSYGLQSFPGLDAYYTDANDNNITRTVSSTSVFGKYLSGGVKVVGKFNGFYATAGFNIGSCNYSNVESYFSYDNYILGTSGNSTSTQTALKMPNSLFVLGIGVGTK